LDTQNYIDSGILELYATGALPSEEMSEVERRVASDPAIAKELAEIREALASLDRHHQRAPRREMRDAILAAIDGEIAPTTSGPMRPSNVVALAPERTRSRYQLAASWVIIALSVGAAAYFGVQWRNAEAEADLLRQENQRLALANSAIADRADQVERSLDIMRSADFHAVQLAGTEQAPHAHPVVYWNPTSREVHLVAKNLPDPPAGKQYQLWALRGDQKIDAGVFETGGERRLPQRLKNIEAADAFAVTLEREGGSPTPDLTAIVAVGKL
jgi:anti-sigma-K factor RskA